MIVLNYRKSKRRGPPALVGNPILALTHNPAVSNSQTTSTWNNCAIGTADDNRYVIVSLPWSNLASRSISNVTINGIDATLIQAQASSTLGNALYISDGPVTSGTTCTVVVTMSGSTTALGLYVFTLRNAVSPVPTQSKLSAPSNVSASATNNILDGGCLLATASWTTSEAGTWSGITEVNQKQLRNSSGTADMSAAILNDLSAETGRTISLTRTTAAAIRLITASWR